METGTVDTIVSVVFFSISSVACAYAYLLDRRFTIRFKEYVMLFETNLIVRRFGIEKGSLVNPPIYVFFAFILWFLTYGNLYIAAIIPAGAAVLHMFALWRSYRKVCQIKGVKRL